MRVLPILFNTEMVRAILDGRKSCTRRLVKGAKNYKHFYEIHDNADGRITCSTNALCAGFYNENNVFFVDGKPQIYAAYYTAPCKPGDILYVRETWCTDVNNEYVYRTNYGKTEDDSFPPSMFKWHPSLHMPKEAARIWLKVIDVRVERLQDITNKEAQREIQRYVESHGYTMTGLSDDYKQRVIFNIEYLMDWAKNYRYRPSAVKRKTLF